MRELKRIRQELLKMQLGMKKDKVYIKAKDGLYLVDFRTGEVKPIDIAPADAEINHLEEASIQDIIICAGYGSPLVVVHDLEDINVADNLDVINIVPASKVSTLE